MTLQRVLDKTDELKSSDMSRDTRIEFINEVEGKIHAEIIMVNAHLASAEECPVYSTEMENETLEDTETELLVPAPWDMIYVYWLMCQIDLQNREMESYNNDRALYENAWEEFANYWRRTHMPITPVQQFYF